MNLIFSTLLLLSSWGTNLETALSKAKSDQKLVILNFSGSDWCGPCILLKKEIFESESFSAFAESKLELVRADFPRQKKNQLSKDLINYNEKLAEKYNPKGKFPLTLLLDTNGKVLHEWDGYPKDLNSEKIIQTIKAPL